MKESFVGPVFGCFRFYFGLGMGFRILVMGRKKGRMGYVKRGGKRTALPTKILVTAVFSQVRDINYIADG